MMMLKKFLIFMGFLVSFEVAFADTLDDILHKLALQNNLHADFVQKKSVPSLKKPLVSKGQLVFNQSQGILWLLQQPVKASIIINQHKIVQKTERSTSKVNTNNNLYAPIANLSAQLMSGNASELRENFDIQDLQQSQQQWHLTLVPKNKNLKQVFSKIKVVGNHYIQQIEISDKQQALTSIQLSNQKNQPLSEAEHALFKLAQ